MILFLIYKNSHMSDSPIISRMICRMRDMIVFVVQYGTLQENIRSMAIFETTSRLQKTFKTNHAEPGDFHLDYILLPIGYAYNAEWGRAKKGDYVKLWDGGRYKIFSVRKLQLNKPIADILSRMRYGITIKRALQKWQMNALMEGNGKNAVSKDECLWVIFERNDED